MVFINAILWMSTTAKITRYNVETGNSNRSNILSKINMSKIITLKNVTVGYEKRAVLKGINLSILEGQWVVILGPNGSGKSTLLKSLLGVLPVMDGTRRSPVKRFGYVPQKFPAPQDSNLTIREFLDLKPGLRGLNLKAEHETICYELGLTEFLSQPLRTLSGGQMQRALLAFSLWDNPSVLFLDEFLAGIDVKGMQTITMYLEKAHTEKNLTVIEVSHDISAVLQIADRVILVKNDILYDGSPQDHGFHECLHKVYGTHYWIRHE